MEPLSITTGILSIVDAGLAIASELRSNLSYPKIAAEVELYSLILRETSDVVLQNAELPSSTTGSFKLCQQRLDDLRQAVSASTPQFASIELALSGFRRSVTLLQDIMMQ
jgi:hypothetical protein